MDIKKKEEINIKMKSNITKNKSNFKIPSLKESEQQSMLIEWANLEVRKYPELKLLFHIPNGGSRNKIEAVNLKRQGVESGIPGLCLPVPRRNFHGLYIEMKTGKNKPTDKQKEWLHDLTEQGYCTSICWGFDEAKEIILDYLNS